MSPFSREQSLAYVSYTLCFPSRLYQDSRFGLTLRVSWCWNRCLLRTAAKEGGALVKPRDAEVRCPFMHLRF